METLKCVTQYGVICGGCVPLPPKPLFTLMPFKLSLPFLEAPQTLFRAQRQPPPCQAAEKAAGLSLGAEIQASNLVGGLAAGFWGWAPGSNPVPGGWQPAEGGPGCVPQHVPTVCTHLQQWF